MGQSDCELIQKSKNNDKAAFTAIIDRYSDRIFSYLWRYVGDYQIAEDLTIETFLNAYNRLKTYEEMGVFSSWLYKIATNCAKKELIRRAKRKETSLDKDVISDAEEDISLKEMIADNTQRPDFSARSAELKEYVYTIISKMKPKYKDVLMLCDVEGLSNEEVAKMLRLNRVTLATRLRRARIMLYEELKHKGFDINQGGPK